MGQDNAVGASALMCDPVAQVFRRKEPAELGQDLKREAAHTQQEDAWMTMAQDDR
jgi:hypothetical protein